MNNATGKRLTDMYRCLKDHFGSQNWLPAESDFEVMVGAVLTQNTNWKNVEQAIDHLKNSGLLSFRALHDVPVSELALKIRSSGYYNIKAKRLKNLLDFLWEHVGEDLSALSREDTQTLRAGLLSVKGIGPETADSILLYAARRPVFVIDAYTHRILHRHGMVGEQTDYHELQALFMDSLPEDVPLFNEFHALIVKTGKHFCRRTPLCHKCPLADWGPIHRRD
ncbi:MAG: endonuclease III domain-containing protein [Deltaproteobacteria bacterium]|nr:endonuclease III domain-containing protein [Deltaproteobacteria bacterium]